MNQEWTDFLASRPAAGMSADEMNCVLNDLTHYGLIRVSGSDAETFLQGQLTNDVRLVTEAHSNLAGWCNAKGRMIANFRCFKRDGDYYLQTPLEHVELVLKRLGMYVLRAQVSLSDASDELIRIGLSGACSEVLLGTACESLPEATNGVQHSGALTLIRLPGSGPRFEIVGPLDDVRALWQKSEGEARVASQDAWALQEIRAGVPTVFEQTREAFVPQMMNMQLVDGVSFTKGCYTGQEVVARMQYLGTLKRRMYLAHVESANLPKPGDELYARESTSGQGAGKVVDARSSGDGCDLLAVIEVASAESGDVLLGDSGPALQIQSLPYAFPE
ncbi:MAG: folate-binding protein YgfZ [Candidatus Thiodiazotropha sp.]